MEKNKIALISVYHKTGVEKFARNLKELGWVIYGSPGTVKYLRDKGVSARDVADLVGGGPLFDRRLVTLSREVHACLLSRPNVLKDIEEMKKLGLPPIGLVYCDFYPLDLETAKRDCTVASVVKETDLGGPAMARSAAKNFLIVICDSADGEMVINSLKESGDVSAEDRQYLRAKAEFVVAKYCLSSACFHGNGDYDGVLAHRVSELGYGENRDQSPAYLFSSDSDDPLAWDKFEVISGNPGFVNVAGGDRALEVLCLMTESFRQNFGSIPHTAIVGKHGNPCGVAISWNDPVAAMRKAMFGNPRAAMGSEVITNFDVTDEVAQILYAVPKEKVAKVGRELWGADIIFAPGFSEHAIRLLGKRKRRRLLTNSALAGEVRMSSDEWVRRPVRGGYMLQKAPRFVFNKDEVEEWVGPIAEKEGLLIDLIIAWGVAWRADSNAVAVAKDEMLIGLGPGQQDRLLCCHLAVNQVKSAGHDADGAVFASDAFFPFAERTRMNRPREGIELLADVGCIGGIVPADGRRLQEVKNFVRKRGMTVAFLPKEHRGFSQH